MKFFRGSAMQSVPFTHAVLVYPPIIKHCALERNEKMTYMYMCTIIVLKNQFTSNNNRYTLSCSRYTCLEIIC